MTGPTTQLREWALHLAECGWAVFPVAAGGKTPALKYWERRATTDPRRVAGYWPTGSTFNIGMACGPSGLVVIDLDTAKTDAEPDGASVLAELAAKRRAQLPDTYTVRTPSGGQHLYYRLPAGVWLGNSSSRLGQRIDTRAAGGFVVAPGSIGADGAYELVDDTDPAELPAWVVQVLTEPRSAIAGPAPLRPSAYATAALVAEAVRIRRAPGGEHNAQVNAAAFNVGQLVGAGLLDPRTAHTVLTDAAAVLAASECECTTRELDRVIACGIEAGTRAPRTHRRGSRGWVA